MALLPILIACGASTRAVVLQVAPPTSQPAGDDQQADASRQTMLIRAVPIATSAMPLPVSIENIQQALEAGGDSGYTDDHGRVTLRLQPGHPHLVVVSPIALGLSGDEAHDPMVWNWRLEPDLKSITPWHTEARGPTALRPDPNAPPLTVVP
ncbi:MAG: hypothetical protein ACTS3F_08440 [Phycisphaerales bacterium]